MAPTIGVNLRVTGHCNQGSRKYMEDMFSVAYQQTEDELDLEYAYFGIFDGHGGHEAATFAKEHLMKAIVSQSGFWSDNDEDILRAIKEGFIATHYAMWRNLENWPRTLSGWPSTSGTTASIAFIRRSNIYIGHVGDSCIVLGYQDPCSDSWKGAPLTMDHKPENPIEQRRINQAGGMVLEKSGVLRVVWHRPRASHKGPLTRSTHFDQIPFLAVARSLGDLWSYNPDSDRFVVSPEPDVSVHHIDLSRDRCLIFGTDGLWNMLSPEEAVNIVKKAESNNKSSSLEGREHAWLNPSKCLVDNALYKWTKRALRADNTSAVTLLLDPLGPPQSQVLDQQNFASQSKSDFVPYHIESYKIYKGKSSKVSSQTSGLAICTWYPQNSTSDSLNKNDGLTTLSTMEELFGEKVDLGRMVKKETTVEEVEKDKPMEESTESETLAPSTSKTFLCELQVRQEKVPANCSTIFWNASRSCGSSSSMIEDENDSVTKAVKDLNIKVTTESNNKVETSKSEPLVLLKQNSHSEENVSKSKNRGSLVIRGPERINSDDANNRDCQKTNFHIKPIKRSRKRGKKRKTYEIIKSEFSILNTKRLRSRSKRRHSSLIETINIMYEPRPKRRTRSEDLRKNYDSEGLKSDAENELDDDISKVSKAMKIKTNMLEAESQEPETSGESRQYHLQERLHNNNNNDIDNDNNINSDNNSDISTSNNNNSNISASNSSNNNNNNNYKNTSNNYNNNSSNKNNNISSSSNNNHNSQDLTPMRLRSNMPVKMLRSRNINLKNCDCLLIGPSKINVNPIKKSLSKQNIKSDDGGEVSTARNSSKVTNVIGRNSLSSTKLHISEPTQKSMVHTRSQNKRLRK